jgi:DNA-binding NtrC family response regulator
MTEEISLMQMQASKAHLHSVSTNDLKAGLPAELVVQHLKNLLTSISAEIERLLAIIEGLDDISKIDIEKGVDLAKEVRQFEITLIQLALRKTHGHQAQAALLLKMHPSTLNEKMKNYGIPRKPRKKTTLETQVAAIAHHG